MNVSVDLSETKYVSKRILWIKISTISLTTRNTRVQNYYDDELPSSDLQRRGLSYLVSPVPDLLHSVSSVPSQIVTVRSTREVRPPVVRYTVG